MLGGNQNQFEKQTYKYKTLSTENSNDENFNQNDFNEILSCNSLFTKAPMKRGNSTAQIRQIQKNFACEDRLIHEKEKQYIRLKERLRNIHMFYRERIQDQRNKNISKNQMAMQMMEELSENHQLKTREFQQIISQNCYHSKDINQVEHRLTLISQTFDKISSQQKQIKNQSQFLKKKLLKKQQTCKLKQKKLESLQSEIMELKEAMETNERKKLKEKRRVREIISMIDSKM